MKGLIKNQTSSPTGWLRMHVWRMFTKVAKIGKCHQKGCRSTKYNICPIFCLKNIILGLLNCSAPQAFIRINTASSVNCAMLKIQIRVTCVWYIGLPNLKKFEFSFMMSQRYWHYFRFLLIWRKSSFGKWENALNEFDIMCSEKLKIQIKRPWPSLFV